jgi:long-subunit acyl-CoA synthetase (AMP-forming)
LLQNNLFSSLLKIPVGYLNNEKATSETIVDGGWLRTGDLAYFDNVGYLYILDRLKDTIKYKGFQVPF